MDKTIDQPKSVEFGKSFEENWKPTEWFRADLVYPEINQEAWNRTASFLGSLAVGPEVRTETIQAMDSSTTIMASAKQAHIDPGAKNQVDRNIDKEVNERLFKAGRITETRMTYNQGRGIEQDGRQVIEILGNNFRFSTLEGEMKLRSTYEYKNCGVLNILADEGILDTHDVLIFSLASKDDEVIENYGFSKDYLTASIQLTSKHGNDIKLDTALFAGKKTKSSERHDIQAVLELARRHNVEIAFDNPAETLDYVLLIPKGQQPYGISDVVRELDDISGGTFFGEAKPRQDYLEYAVHQKAINFDDIVQKISSQFIAEAQSFKHPLQAVKRLGRLADYYTVKHSVRDSSIDLTIFGIESALLIQQARESIEKGDVVSASEQIEEAYQKSTNNSCPQFNGTNQNEEGNSENVEKSAKKWMNCPHCKAKVFDDPCAKVLSCWDCKALVINGSVVSKGNGGTRKRKQEKAKLLRMKPVNV